MKKIFALATVGIAAAVGTVYTTQPDEWQNVARTAKMLGVRVWSGIEANPAPVIIALGTFLVTIVYHKLKGKSLRESVEAAATRVTVVPVPTHATDANESQVVIRAKARATRAQLIADQIALENRYRKLPTEVKQAEKDACYTEHALADARRALEVKQKTHEDAVAKLESLRKELALSNAELAAIQAELTKLAEVV